MIDFSKTRTFGQFVERIGKEFSNQTAFIYRPRYRAITWTYTDLLNASKMFAAFLEENKVKKGDRIVIWAGNSPYWAATFFGCQLKGVVAVPLGITNTQGFVKKIAKITEAKLVIKNQALVANAAGVPVHDVEEVFDGWEKKPRSFKKPKSTPNDLAEILFTSGTTGEPKGVKLKHSNILSNVKAISTLGVIDDTDRHLSFLPLSHILEQVGGLFTPLAWGNQITQAASLSSLHIRLNMAEEHPTKMTAVPEFLKLALGRIEETAKKEGKMESLEKLYRLAPKLPVFLRRKLAKDVIENFGGELDTIVAGGAAMDPDVGRKFEALGMTILQGYGATETSPVVALNLPDDRKMDSVGPIIEDVEVKIADDGEILVKGPNVVEGYYKNPEKTKDAFKGGWYYTDDIGYLDEDGHLHIKGRKKFLIVRPSGENVFPDEIEKLLGDQENVADSAVVGLELDGQFQVHAVLLPKHGKTVKGERVVEGANKHLEPYQRIDGFSIWPEQDFPRSQTRKVKKQEVIEWLEKQDRKQAKPISGEIGSVERVLASLTSKQAKDIKPSTKLVADLKMDSLQRVMFVAAMEEDAGVLLDEGLIDAKTTVKDIKDALAKKENRETRYGFMEWPLRLLNRILRQILQSIVLYPVILLSSQLRMKGRERLKPIDGPVMFYANHVSALDAPFLLRALPLRLRWKLAIAAATDAVWEDPWLVRFSKFIIFGGNAYPISRRSQVKAALEYSGRLVDRGYSLMIFPESYISQSGLLQPLKQGAGFFAVEMDVPVYPIYITGTEVINPYRSRQFLWWRRPEVRIHFGEKIEVKGGETYQEATTRIYSAMKELEQEARPNR